MNNPKTLKIAIPKVMLDDFDKYVVSKHGVDRSEYIRNMIRKEIIEAKKTK